MAISGSVRMTTLLAAVTLLLLTASSWAQQEEMMEHPTTGTIQGTLRDEDGNIVGSSRIFYSSSVTDTRGSVRGNKDGTYVTEQLPPGPYVVRVEGRDKRPLERTVTVEAGAVTKADFSLEAINPGPARLENQYSGDVPDTLPINGRNYLGPGEVDPGVQVVDGAALDPGKSGFQTLSINSVTGRTTHYDMDEVEVMDETKGLAIMSLPSEAVRSVVVSEVTPEVFQSLNATGAVRVSTQFASDIPGGGKWHGNLFGNLRDQVLGTSGFPSGPSDYSRQQFGFGAGGAVIKDKAFLFVGGERTKQDGLMPGQYGFPCTGPYVAGLCDTSRSGLIGLQSAYFRENMLSARLDYNFNENMKGFLRYSYDNANLIGPSSSQSNYRNQFNVPALVVGLDWNHGRFVNSARFGIQKMVNAVNPAPGASTIFQSAPFNIQIGPYALGPTSAGPRQTIQRDLFGRYDGSISPDRYNTVRFGGAIHRIAQGDYFAPGTYGPSVTSSDGMAVINAINSDSSLVPMIPGDPRGAADNPLNYPVGTFAIFNGLGNFSENSAFNRSNGGHFDTRIEGYVGDTYKARPSLNISIGVNYVRDTGRTDSDLAPIPCSALNPGLGIPCTTGLILNEFALVPVNSLFPQPNVGQRINQPNLNFSPQVGLAWDPGHSGRTVVRVSGGLFYDNFLLQNTYQDRINRLSNGQYNRSLTLCPTGSVLFPNGSLVSSVDGLDIASQICGQPIGAVSGALQDLQKEFLAAQSAVTGGPNVYSLANSLANFGGMLAPGFKTPRVVHMSVGFQHQVGERSNFSLDYVREMGTQFPLGIDTNHVGAANYLTDGSNPQSNLNTYASELSAITATVAPAGCPAATFSGGGVGSSQAAVNCYLTNVPTASITDFARNGLDSSNAFCGPFPCSVLGKQQASFGGINPAVGSNVMYFPSGTSKYSALRLTYSTSSGENPMRRVQHYTGAISYTLSRYRTNIAEPDGSGGDYSELNRAENYYSPHRGYWGDSGLDRTHQFTLSPTVELSHAVHVSWITHIASPLPLSANIPQQNGGGVAGEIFRSDVTGDGTVGDLIPGTIIGSTGKYSNTDLTNVIKAYNRNVAGQLTPAGDVLVGAGLFSVTQLHALGAYLPVIQGLPEHAAQATWLKTMDLRVSRPFQVGERFKVEPDISIFNLFNFANFGGPGGQLSGVLDGAPGSSLNNASSGGFCGNSINFCTSRLDRVLPGSGTYANGAPRAIEFGVRVTF